jgi:hypothetical protein
MIMEANRQTSDIPDLRDLKSKYSLKISDVLLDSSIDPWEARDLLIVSRTYDGTGACIKPGKYGPALSELLQILDATTFEVNWAKEEILTDAASDSSWPGLAGWKIFQFDGDARQNAPTDIVSANHFSSSDWTGLPSAFELTEEKRQKLVRELELADEQLAGLGLGQATQAQARAYFVAARILAEAPEPPADLIWNIIGRANSLAGIASLLISIIALFK